MAGEKEDNVTAVRDNAMAESFVEGKVSDNTEDIVHAAESEFTAEQYRKLLWKIDLIILPMMWVSWHTDLGRAESEAPAYTDKAEVDLLRRAICGQGLGINTSHLWLEGGYSLGWTAVLLLVSPVDSIR